LAFERRDLAASGYNPNLKKKFGCQQGRRVPILGQAETA